MRSRCCRTGADGGRKPRSTRHRIRGREVAPVAIEHRERVKELDSGRHPKRQQVLDLAAANEA